MLLPLQVAADADSYLTHIYVDQHLVKRFEIAELDIDAKVAYDQR